MFSFEIEAENFWAGRNLGDNLNPTVKSSFFKIEEELEIPQPPCHAQGDTVGGKAKTLSQP